MRRLPHGRRAVAWIGVLVGVSAALVALPPIQVRSPVAPVVFGLFALTIGIGSWIRGERRIGGYAIATGVLGLMIGYLATRSSVEHLDAVVVWGALFAATLRYATPLVFASIGGLFSERSGVVNIGLEGMMLMGAFFAVWGADVTGQWTLGLAIGMVAGGLTGLLHAFFAVSLRADQIVGGTAINFLALGLTTYLFFKIYGSEGTPTDLSTIPDVWLGFLDGIPVVGDFLYDIFGQLDLMIWIAIFLVVATWVVVFKTPIGLRIRSVRTRRRLVGSTSMRSLRRGDGVRHARRASVGTYRSVCQLVRRQQTAGRGFIALAALIFGNWRPFGAAVACLLFGFSSALSDFLQEYSTSVSTLFEALPYVLTLVAVAGVIGKSIPPAAVGRPYTKQ